MRLDVMWYYVIRPSTWNGSNHFWTIKVKTKRKEEMWFKKDGLMVHITYHAVWDKEDNYVGCLEYVCKYPIVSGSFNQADVKRTLLNDFLILQCTWIHSTLHLTLKELLTYVYDDDSRCNCWSKFILIRDVQLMYDGLRSRSSVWKVDYSVN